MLLVPALAAVLAAGCGGNGGDDGGNAEDLRLKEEAAAKVERAADKVVQATPDKNLPGPKSYKMVCLRRGEEGAGDIPEDQIKCHVEAFYDNYRGEPGGYIWSEDWLVPILADGELGTPRIFGEYRIRNFLRENNRKNCTGRHRPHECLPADAYPAPPVGQQQQPQGEQPITPEGQ